MIRQSRLRTNGLLGVFLALCMIGAHLVFCWQESLIGLALIGYAFGVFLGVGRAFNAILLKKEKLKERSIIVERVSKKQHNTLAIIQMVVVLVLVFGLYMFRVHERISPEGLEWLVKVGISSGGGIGLGSSLTMLVAMLIWVVWYEKRNGVKLRQERQYI